MRGPNADAARGLLQEKEHSMTVEKKDLDWGNIGFNYMQTDYSYEHIGRMASGTRAA